MILFPGLPAEHWPHRRPRGTSSGGLCGRRWARRRERSGRRRSRSWAAPGPPPGRGKRSGPRTPRPPAVCPATPPPRRGSAPDTWGCPTSPPAGRRNSGSPSPGRPQGRPPWRSMFRLHRDRCC